MGRLRSLLLVITAALTLSFVAAGCECLDETGNTYTCSCTKRCQGVTSTYTTGIGCSTSNPSSSASASCVRSCSPEASCASCTCTKGPECTITHTCR